MSPSSRPLRLIASSAILVGCVAVLVSSAVCAQAQSARPNVLLILADDLGYSDTGCMGGEIPTPNIDRLAAGGLRFTQCYNSARCCPSRASLMTGLYPHQAGIGSFATSQPDAKKGPAYLGHLNDQCVTLAEVLRGTGYGTYMVGKWHMEEPGPIARGFQEFYGFVHGYEQNQWQPQRYTRLPKDRAPELIFERDNFYATDAFTDYAVEFLKQARTKKTEDGTTQPWFLYMAHSAPHFPVQAPAEDAARFVETYRRGWDVLRSERFERMQQSGLADATWTLTDRSVVPIDDNNIANGFSGEQNPAWDSLPADRREDLAYRMAVFAAMVSHLDAGVGRLLADLETHGELDNTIILFLSDNGACYEWGPFGFDGPSRRAETILHQGDQLAQMGGPGTYHAYGSGWANLGNTPLRMYKHFAYEGGNCTPLFVHWPQGIKSNDRWINDPVHVMDVMPTLCEVAGAKYPQSQGGHAVLPSEGASLAPYFSGGAIAERPIASEHNESASLRHGDWKVVHAVRQPGGDAWELYNIRADRCETRNVAAEHPEIARQLIDEWTSWAKRAKVYPYSQPAAEEIRSPQISQRAIEIQVEGMLPSLTETGVLLAQGGRRHGYALHLQDGKLIFSVRVDGQLTVTEPFALREKAFKLTAELAADGQMTLQLGDQVIAKATAPALIPEQPTDALTIGSDERTAVGNYRAPLPFAGQITRVVINRTVFRGER